MTTLVSFQASELDSKAREMTFVGIMELTKGNDAYAVADKQSGDDYDAVTQIILLEETGGSQTAHQPFGRFAEGFDRNDEIPELGYIAV